MSKPEDGAWYPWQLKALASSIEALDAEDRQTVERAIDALLVDPYNPAGFSVRPLKKVGHRQRWLLTLPNGIAIQYEPVEGGLPPAPMRPTVIFWSISAISEVDITDTQDRRESFSPDAPDAVTTTNDKVWRFAKYLSSIAAGTTDPVIGTYPDIDNGRWFDPRRFPICAALEENFAEVKREILALPPRIFYPDSEQIPRAGEWAIFPVLAMARKNLANASLLPVTTGIAESHGAIKTLTGGILVSNLKPGTIISSHRGPSNSRIRCHLGIQIPPGDCGIEVDGERRTWQEGACLMLNDHLEHNVWNRTETERIVLIVDVWHPDLTEVEKTLLTGLHVYADVQSQAISTWHERNSRAQETSRSKMPPTTA